LANVLAHFVENIVLAVSVAAVADTFVAVADVVEVAALIVVSAIHNVELFILHLWSC
jgi:hypothetical protein